jgi:hypothetical protein
METKLLCISLVAAGNGIEGVPRQSEILKFIVSDLTIVFLPVNAPALAFFAKGRHMRFEMIANWVSLAIQWNLSIPDNRNNEIVCKWPTLRPTLNHSTTYNSSSVIQITPQAFSHWSFAKILCQPQEATGVLRPLFNYCAAW